MSLFSCKVNVAIRVSGFLLYGFFFFLSDKFLGNQLLSYGQNLTFSFRVDRRDTRLSAEDIVLEGSGLRVSVPLIAQGNSYPSENTLRYTFR